MKLNVMIYNSLNRINIILLIFGSGVVAYWLTLWSIVLEIPVAQLAGNFLSVMKPRSLLLNSQEPTTGLYSEPDEFSP